MKLYYFLMIVFCNFKYKVASSGYVLATKRNLCTADRKSEHVQTESLTYDLVNLCFNFKLLK